MRALVKLTAFALSLSLCAGPALAQTNTQPPAVKQSDDAAKADLYDRIGRRDRGPRTPEEQKAAYETGKEFLRKYGHMENDEYVRAVRRWVGKYEAAVCEFELGRAAEAESASTASAPARLGCRAAKAVARYW